MNKKLAWIFLMMPGWFFGTALAQISPGDLAEVHAHLEGISNCTQCHTLGAKVTNEKCLACHTELKTRIEARKGYHSSLKMRGRDCVSCHSDHHGRKFEIVRFKTEDFDHNLTGYEIIGAHTKKTCADCHKPANIADEAIRKKKFTYLGLSTECLGCHTDYHQKTLSATCTDCHGVDAFNPTTKFDHNNTKFPLTGKHQTVVCTECHPKVTKNGVEFQEFAGKKHANCTSCHTEPHQGKFGQRCTDCHTTESFHTIKGMTSFDHSKTNFKLENKHRNLTCASCHKGNLTDPVKHSSCSDCHKDYHEGQFTKEGIVSDCASCHTTKGFPGSSFTIERHNEGAFKLEGAHLATPCFVCHKKSEKWNFRKIGTRCTDCHTNIHEPFLSKEYYPENDCRRCHEETQWSVIAFDHSATRFALAGAHAQQTCRTCHFKKNEQGEEYQVFSELSSHCTTCHTDIHYGQFEVDGKINCLRCHEPNKWKIQQFNHNLTAFKLDGKHENLACNQCHKPVQKGENTYTLYKIGDTRCEHCH
ncbi:MAG: cytochrome C [Bacteroidales bacterium]|nr:cytochrome C [Bacteroidales bacterium]